MERHEREKMRGKEINFKKNKELNRTQRLKKKFNKKQTNHDGQYKMLYPSYIRSKAWLERRIKFYDSFGRNCAVCGASNDTTVHHMSYLHLGNEKDNELVVLCRPHHRDYHSQNGVQGNMIKRTHAYIKAQREEIQGEIQKEKLAREEAQIEAVGTL